MPPGQFLLMKSFSSTHELAANFVVAYYTSFVYKKDDIAKFYDENAVINRPSFSSPKPLSQARLELAVSFQDGSVLNVSSYNATASEETILLNVTGYLNFNEIKRPFIQNFVLQEKYGRIFIIIDSYQYFEVNTVFAEADHNYVVPSPKPVVTPQPKVERRQQPPPPATAAPQATPVNIIPPVNEGWIEAKQEPWNQNEQSWNQNNQMKQGHKINNEENDNIRRGGGRGRGGFRGGDRGKGNRGRGGERGRRPNPRYNPE